MATSRTNARRTRGGGRVVWGAIHRRSKRRTHPLVAKLDSTLEVDEAVHQELLQHFGRQVLWRVEGRVRQSADLIDAQMRPPMHELRRLRGALRLERLRIAARAGHPVGF